MKAKRLPQEGIVLEVIENLHEVIWAKIVSGVKKFIKEFIENLLTEEVTDRIGAGRYERSTKRQGYRNGHYFRNLLTKFGPIEDIRVTRLDQGGMEFTVLNRYEHRRRDVDAAIGRLFLNGMSTRELKGLARELFGKEVSAPDREPHLGLPGSGVGGLSHQAPERHRGVSLPGWHQQQSPGDRHREKSGAVRVYARCSMRPRVLRGLLALLELPQSKIHLL
jgi:hypothetical protein